METIISVWRDFIQRENCHIEEEEENANSLVVREKEQEKQTG